MRRKAVPAMGVSTDLGLRALFSCRDSGDKQTMRENDAIQPTRG
jgi:hypothetical protein